MGAGGVGMVVDLCRFPFRGRVGGGTLTGSPVGAVGRVGAVLGEEALVGEGEELRAFIMVGEGDVLRVGVVVREILRSFADLGRFVLVVSQSVLGLAAKFGESELSVGSSDELRLMWFC